MISSQHKNANIANFVLAIPFKIQRLLQSAALKCNPFYQLTSKFQIYKNRKIEIMKKTANKWEYKVGINIIIAKVVRL